MNGNFAKLWRPRPRRTGVKCGRGLHCCSAVLGRIPPPRAEDLPNDANLAHIFPHDRVTEDNLRALEAEQAEEARNIPRQDRRTA